MIVPEADLSPDAQQLINQAHEYRRSGDWQHAIQLYKQALAIDPDSPAAVHLEMAEHILTEWNRSMYDV